MVLRSGIIIPFQFRDNKKLLMIGVPEENRDLSIWDLKNVVRAAFGIYNFEFRNKKIGFNIPDELLLNYLAQRHDLTNFVIEVGQALEGPTKNVQHKANEKESLSYEPSCSQILKVPLPQKSSESSNDAIIPNLTIQAENSPQEATRNNQTSNHLSTNQEPPQKLRITQVYSEHSSPETLTQSIDPMDIIPKSEQDESELEMRNSRYESRIASMQQHQQQYFQSYGHNMLGHAAQHAAQQYSPGNYNRFRRRGERMSKDQKELYVKYFEENPCMLTQRRNDIMLEPHWHKLCNMLNSVPQGAVKNIEEWKQTFDAWRYRVFMYTRYNSKLTGIAAQNPKNYKPLTPTDQRAYVMWTSHKGTAPQDFEKMDMFAQLDDTNADFDY